MPKSRGRKNKHSSGQQPTEIKLTARAAEILRQQLDAFRKKFGREPGPGDPVFFDPDAHEPTPTRDIQQDVLAAMEKAKLPPEFAYAGEPGCWD